jgi:menaquinone-dependent protoporphyrinogen IX oxidase
MKPLIAFHSRTGYTRRIAARNHEAALGAFVTALA